MQRVTLGWEGAADDSWNKTQQTVTAEGHKAAAGETGALRIPVSGIAAGRTGGLKGESGGGSDPNIAAKLEEINKADPEVRAKKKKPLTSLEVSSVTSESAAASTGGEAIVIVPPGLPAGAVDVLFHLHGHTIGYRQVKHGKAEAPPPRDVQYDRVEQQLLAASQAGLPMVGILPQGTFYSRFGPEGQAGVNVSNYVDQVFALGLDPLKGRSPGRVTLSGWSGAGLAITEMIAGTEAKQGGGKVPGGEKGSLLPTGAFEGLFLFDAIYGKLGKSSNWLNPIWRFLHSQLEKELVELTALTGGGADASAIAAKQENHLATKGFRFRGIYTDSGGCKANYEHLRDQYLQKDWFGSDAVKALPASVQQTWRANYQVQYAGKGVSHNLMIGKQGGASQENLLKALEMLPKPAAAAPPAGAHGRAGPPAHARPSPVPTRQPGAAVTGSHPGAVPAPAPGGAPDQILIAAAVALGRVDKNGGRPAGGTLLRQDDVRAALDKRIGNPSINERFTQALAVVAATPAVGQIAAAQQQASGLVHALELQFILDPARSALDLLPPDRAKHWREFQWDPKDYPGGPKGAHEAKARAMVREFAADVRPERRPNQGADAVVTKSEMTDERWRYIAKHSPQVSGEDQALFAEAGDSFVKMREAAKADGVKLRILSGYRPHKVAEARAKKAANPEAVASFSSHSLGLAADLEMWGGKNPKGEISTADMAKVTDMRAQPAHKWMVLRGEEFHWYPYGNEPWHWEYNPPGLKERFFKAGTAVPAAPAARPAEMSTVEKQKAEKPAPPATAGAAPATKAPAKADDPRLSGPHWASVKDYEGSNSLDTLKQPFQANVSRFIDTLRANRARVNISATYRPPERAWLMHWAWFIGKGKIKYSQIGSIKNPYGIDIVWDHGDEKLTRKAALAMVQAFHMKHAAVLQSRHTERRAIDMTITRLPEVLLIDKQQYPIGTAAADSNEMLWFVGDKLFSVIKLPSDPPHWSDDGH